MRQHEPSRGGCGRQWCVLLLIFAACGMGAQPRQPAPSPPLPEGLRQPPSGPPFKVAPVDRVKRGDVLAAAAAIDEILTARQKMDGVEPGTPLTESQFVRRVYLDLGGRIPTCDESLRFFASKREDKRAELIDALLESPDYVSRFYSVWAETLRLTEKKHVEYAPYLDWVKRSIAENRPYDEWVREMLTADGTIYSNPAVGYQLRDIGMPLPYVDNTVRVFLGTQIGCAQCHDHPHESWTQRQFYELAAFTAGDLTGFGQRDIRGRFWDSKKHEREIQGDLAAGPQMWLMNNANAVAHRPQPLSLPDRSKSPSAAPQSVDGKVLWGELPADAAGLDSRAQLAHWLTSRDNRQFARTIANRLWKTLMGVGIVEPIDNFSDEHPPSHPELLEHLTDEILRLDFDLREFIRVVVSTAAWQNQAVPYDPTGGETFAFTGPALRRMSAEQVWDSVVTLVATDIWAYQRPRFEEFTASAYDIFAGEIDVEAARESFQRQVALPFHEREKMLRARFGYGHSAYARASELPTPVELNHPLRMFGQSERETIDGGRSSATISQALSLLNGDFPGVVFEPGAAVGTAIASRPRRDWVDVIFVSILTRRPDKEERAIAEAEIAAGKTPLAGMVNVLAALLNTREFLFIQ